MTGLQRVGSRQVHLALLWLFLALMATNAQPLPGRIYLQFLFYGLLCLAYALASILILNLKRVNASALAGLLLLACSYAFFSFTNGQTAASIASVLKYASFLLSFPVFLSLFEGLDARAKERALLFYACLVVGMGVLFEYEALLEFRKPVFQFLGGYNGANVHFLFVFLFCAHRLLVRSEEAPSRLVLGILLLACLWLMAGTRSRQPFLLVGVAVAAVVREGWRSREVRKTGLVALLIAFGLLTFLLVLSGAYERYIMEFQGFQSNTPVSTMERYLILWQFYHESSPGSLWTGLGFGKTFLKLDGVPTESVHIGLLQPLVNGGLVLFAACLLVYSHYYRHDSKPGSLKRLFLGVFIFANLFDSHFYSFQVLWVPALALALLEGDFRKGSAPSDTAA